MQLGGSFLMLGANFLDTYLHVRLLLSISVFGVGVFCVWRGTRIERLEQWE